MMLYLFTQSYPYDSASERTFVGPEIPYLREHFDKVVLVPKMLKGSKDETPAFIEVNELYSRFLYRNLPLPALRRSTLRMIAREFRTRPSILRSPAKLMKLVLFSLRAELTREWMSAQLRDQRLDPGQTILYSYWFDHAAAGLALLKEQFPQVRVVSRAHGFDIFEEHYFPYYWPRRRETLAALDRLFLASEAGRRYFMDRYPEFASKYETAHLGTRKPGMIASPSNDNVFRIVSCSNIVPIKRLDLLVDGIASAARLRADQQFDWTHIGDGAGRQVLERHMRRTLPANARGNLLGFLPNTEILRLYGEQPWDVFINVSKSEGGAPLAIQEAISCGMPVIAASVGGNPEIVSDGNGILLSPTPSPAEIAGALLRLRDNPSLAASLRTGSRQVWKQRFDAEVNFRSFAGKLANLSVRQEIGASP